MESFLCLVWFTETHSPSFHLLQRVFLPSPPASSRFCLASQSWKDLSDNLIELLHCEERETEAQRPEPRCSHPQTSIPTTTLHLALFVFQLGTFGIASNPRIQPCFPRQRIQAPTIMIMWTLLPACGHFLTRASSYPHHAP